MATLWRPLLLGLEPLHKVGCWFLHNACSRNRAFHLLPLSEIIPCFGLQVVVVLDPDVSKEYLDRVQGRSKEKKYAYDVAFGAEATNEVLTLLVIT
jgi:hypothetical protein